MRHLAIAPVLFSVAAACGDPDPAAQFDECVDLCAAAQAGSCTSVSGNCGSFCAALDLVQDPAGCSDERDTYQACLAEGIDVCVNDCDAEESALSTCIGAYCTANPSNDCATLVASF